MTLHNPAQSEKSRETEAGKGGLLEQERSCRHAVTCFQERIVFVRFKFFVISYGRCLFIF